MITAKLFNSLFPTIGLNPRKFNLVRKRDELIDALNRILPKYGIDNYLRICAFLGNCGIETDYFKTTIEYASGWDYDISVNPAKARSLGNYHKGDGPKFKGSGLSQTTGGFNFGELNRIVGKRLGIDFTKNPEKLREDIDIAVESACIFWDSHNLNSYADRGEFKQLSAIVNRGDENLTPMHWAKRNELYSLLKRRIPVDFSFAPTAIVQPAQPSPSAPEADNPAPVVLTPVNDNQPPEGEKSKVKELGEKYLRHCPEDTVKNICGVVSARVGASVSTVWALGLSGKIFLIAAGIITAGFIAYALYYYTPRIIGWIENAADSILPNE